MLSPSEFDRLNSQSHFMSAEQQGLNDEQAGRIVTESLVTGINIYPYHATLKTLWILTNY